MKPNIRPFMPCSGWLPEYSRQLLLKDTIASASISALMIPQAMAYAMLAGLPPQLGLYACILPLLAYSFWGSSGALSIGPFAITSIMTAAALSQLFPLDSYSLDDRIVAAALLALLSGLLLITAGVLRLGFLTNFISLPVVSGFISASALIIAASQFSNIIGMPTVDSEDWPHSYELSQVLVTINPITLAVSGISLAGLILLPRLLKAGLPKIGVTSTTTATVAKCSPLVVLAIATGSSAYWDWHQLGLAVVGDIPSGLPDIRLPDWHHSDWSESLWSELLKSAALISIIGYISALSTAQLFAAKQRQRINPNREAVSLGAANLASSVSGAFPVAASLSRSAVAFNAGAATPAASAITAIAIALATCFLPPYFYHLPIASLAALILLTVTSLVDIDAMRRCWHYSRKDFAALAATFAITLAGSIEQGLITGILLSIGLHLYRSSHPHSAVMGLIPGTHHFRNIERHEVITDSGLIIYRIDASLYFANTAFLQDQANRLVARYPEAKHLLLVCSAINDIDASAMEGLITLNDQLYNAGIRLHLSEVKGPIMDRFQHSSLPHNLHGEIFLDTYDAWSKLTGRGNTH